MTPEKRRRPLTRASASPITPPGPQSLTLNTSSSENFSGDLLIDIQNDDDIAKHSASGKDELTNDKPKRIYRRKRRKMSNPCDADELFDAKFEDTIRKAATKNNLTPICVKRLLKKLVMNDHVFAIVRLKEEEEEKTSQQTKEENSQEADDGDDEDDDENCDNQPKLTRLKAKQLNQTLFPLVPLNASGTDEDVAALIREDLNSDDDDEEYKPGEDDAPSDDDPNTTISDIDSQPRTPATTVSAVGFDIESELQYTKDGLFKIPKPRNDSYCSQSEQEQENIALRTRSKLCLTTTDIETLESTFIPPDITTDMYEYDGDMDQAWKDFLEEFTKPLPQDLEDDDDNDPEYVAADKVPLDAEEMRAVKVSKKELNELISELMEMSNIDEPYLEQALNETINESLNCTQLDNRTEMLRTPGPESSELQSTSSLTQSSFPTITGKLPAVELAGHSNTTSEDQNISMLASSFTCTPGVSTYSAGASTDNAVNQYLEHAPNMLQKADITDGHIFTDGQILNVQNSERFFIKYSIPDETYPSPHDPSVILKPANFEKKRFRFHTTEVPVKVALSDAPVGFTDFQLQLLQQQLRMHVQLTAQHFLQTYAHPLFWEKAKTCEDMLEEVEAVTNTKPNILPWNLPLALDCCRSWKDELETVNEHNKLYIKYLDDEIAHAEEIRRNSNKHYQGELHERIRAKIINCRAFMYSSLIPYKTFRYSQFESKQGRYTRCELQLIAFWFERSCEEMQQKHNGQWPDRKMKKPKMRQIITHLVRYIWPHYKWSQLQALVYHKRSIHSNPIDHFVRNGRAPPFKQVLEYIDFENVIPMAAYQRGILPSNWDRFIASYKPSSNTEQKETSRSSKINVQHPQPNQPCSALPETSDVSAPLQYEIKVLLQEDPSTTPLHKKITSTTSASGKKCESAAYGVIQPFHDNVVTNCDEVSLSVVLAIEPKIAEGMHNGTPCKYSMSSSVDSLIVGGTCTCHCSLHPGTQEIPVPDGVSHRTELTDSEQSGDKYGTQVAYDTTPRSVSLIPQNKNVAKHSVERLAASATLYSALKRYLRELHDECERNSSGASILKPPHPLGKVYAHLLQLQVYSRYLDGLRNMCENLGTYCYQYRTLQQYNPQRLSSSLQLFSSEQVDGSLVVRARYISHRFDDYCSMEDKDALFAFNYYEKVEETLLASGRSDLLERFEEVLQKFNELEDRVPQLYYQVEDLLSESFPELVDMFLTFLLPGQAAEIGRFFEHFILTNMNDFLEKLNIFFAKQPSQIKKVHACLNELSNDPNVTMDQVKLKVLPLLKGSTLLSEWFLQLFPSERPPESPLCDYENVTLKKTPLVESCEPGVVYEQVPYVEAAPETTENAAPPNAIRYIQGRIYQGTLPARLTFLAKNCVVDNDAPQEILEQNLCDEATLRAHAIRLNPLVHCPKGVTYTDVASLLTSNGNANANVAPPCEVVPESVNTEDESKGASSPKKAPPKLPIKKRYNSPSSRKLIYSPNEECSVSTSPGKEPPMLKRTPHVPITVPPDSKALSTSKKLRSIIETGPPTAKEETHHEIPLAAPLMCTAAPTVDPPLTRTSDVPALATDRNEVNETEPSHCQPSEAPSWTRQEDEIILLKIIKGYTSVDTFVQLIEQQLPERSSEQIRSRVEFLNEMLRRVNQK